MEMIDSEVRESVRERGLYPMTESHLVRRIDDEVVTDYDERRLSQNLPPLGDYATVSQAVLDAVAGCGPLQPFLDDPNVEEIWINEPSRGLIACNGRSEVPTVTLTGQENRELVA